MTSQFVDMTSSSIYFDVLFLLSGLVTGPSFMSILSLVLELWQFSFIGDWPEIQKSEIPQSEFCPISGDWSELGIPNLARMSLLKCYWMLQNVRVTACTVSELLSSPPYTHTHTHTHTRARARAHTHTRTHREIRVKSVDVWLIQDRIIQTGKYCQCTNGYIVL